MPQQPAKRREVEFRSADGFDLRGTITSANPHRAWVVMAHGINETRDEYGGFYVDIADRLASLGISTLRFDFRGHGESSGTSMDISIVGDVLDVDAAVRQIGGIPDLKVGFVGTSFGSGPVALWAGQNRSNVGPIVLIAPVIDYARTFLEPRTPWARASFTREAFLALPTRGYLVLDGTQQLSPRLIEEFHLLRPYESLLGLSTPRLIIHGDKDSLVPYEVSKDIAGPGGVQLITLHDADHGFTDAKTDDDASPASLANRSKLVEATASFLSRGLGQSIC